jgi:hypothetical protein
MIEKIIMRPRCGGGKTLARHVVLAARAKVKVKASARGWSMLSKDEIIALAFIADVFLEDGALPNPAPAKSAPAVISNV